MTELKCPSLYLSLHSLSEKKALNICKKKIIKVPRSTVRELSDDMQQVVVCIEEMEAQLFDLRRQIVIAKNYVMRLQEGVIDCLDIPPQDVNC